MELPAESLHVLQRCVFAADRRLDPLYHRVLGPDGTPVDGPPPDRNAIDLPGGARLTTDTWFNLFFEGYWRRHTRLERLRLRLRLAGCGRVTVFRRARGVPARPVRALAFAADGLVEADVPAPEPAEAGSAALHFEVEAGPWGARLLGAEWVAVNALARSVRLAVGICTFDRPAALLANAAALLGKELLGVVRRLVVVDQGRDKVRAHPDWHTLPPERGDRLVVVEQDNQGGAGGFTRCILEVRRASRATHLLLMDDDVVVETEGVFRLAAFFALVRGDLAVGGPMLDAGRPREFHAGGTFVRAADFGTYKALPARDVTQAESLSAFLEAEQPDYNPWWFFGFPLPLIDHVGLPLPLFLRGDDAEFGVRLRQRGVATVTLPGVGVWHEPLEARDGGWHPYYDQRNLLILTALHRPQPSYRAALVFLRRLLNKLLCLDYFQAGLLCDAVEDYLRGPESLAEPADLHRRLMAAYRAARQARDATEAPTSTEAQVLAPASLAGRVFRFLRCLVRQLLRSPTPSRPAPLVPLEHAGWWSLGNVDAAILTGSGGARLQIRRRCRGRFFALLWRGLRSAARLVLAPLANRTGGATVRRWQAALGQLTDEASWNDRLNIRPNREERPEAA